MIPMIPMIPIIPIIPMIPMIQKMNNSQIRNWKSNKFLNIKINY
jgi:hypothetical protein